MRVKGIVDVRGVATKLLQHLARLYAMDPECAQACQAIVSSVQQGPSSAQNEALDAQGCSTSLVRDVQKELGQKLPHPANNKTNKHRAGFLPGSAIVGGGQDVRGVSGEAGRGDPLVVGTLIPPQALACPHLPHLQII